MLYHYGKYSSLCASTEAEEGQLENRLAGQIRLSRFVATQLGISFPLIQPLDRQRG